MEKQLKLQKNPIKKEMERGKKNPYKKKRIKIFFNPKKNKKDKKKTKKI